jgi:beta-lactamase regulating signal transducer with metallopeptidase domain
MTPTTAIQASTSLLARLADPAGRALALACVAALVLAAFRVRATSVRLFTWTAVLYTALAMPLLGWMIPQLSIPTPAFIQRMALQPVPAGAQDTQHLASSELSQPAVEAVVALNKFTPGESAGGNGHSDLAHPSVSRPAPLLVRTPLTVAAPAASDSINWAAIPWNEIAAGIYFVVALLLLSRFFVGIVLGRRLMRAAQNLDDPRMAMRLASRAYVAGLAGVPRAAESDLITVPVTMGALRSTILLPADWREWDDAKLDAVIAHEISHVARRDALTQRISLLHRAIFWFSPLAWWLDRHLADLAEEASDEAALSCGADRTHYARTLLGFFEALQTAPGRVWWQGVSMAKAGQAEKRVDRILAWKGAVNMGLKKSLAAGIVALALPVVFLAASVHPANNYAGLQSANPAQDQAPPPPASPRPAPPAKPPANGVNAPSALAPAAPLDPVAGIAPLPPVPAIAGTISGAVSGTIAPRAPIGGVIAPAELIAPPSAFWSGQSGSSGSSSSYGQGNSFSYGFDDDERFVIVTGKSDSLTMSGSVGDARHVQELRKKIPGDFIWFQHDEKNYVITDPAVIQRAKKLWEPQEELGRKQEELGKQQEALGAQQEALGKKMEEVHVKVPDMSADLDKLKAELKQLSDGGTQEQLGNLQSEIGDLQSKLGDLQSHAGDQQGKLGEEMGKLGEQQGKLGEEQGKLGEEQGKLARKASLEMKVIFEEAISNGTAKPE